VPATTFEGSITGDAGQQRVRHERRRRADRRTCRQKARESTRFARTTRGESIQASTFLAVFAIAPTTLQETAVTPDSYTCEIDNSVGQFTRNRQVCRRAKRISGAARGSAGSQRRGREGQKDSRDTNVVEPSEMLAGSTGLEPFLRVFLKFYMRTLTRGIAALELVLCRIFSPRIWRRGCRLEHECCSSCSWGIEGALRPRPAQRWSRSAFSGSIAAARRAGR
jgi:hypothetical protein